MKRALSILLMVGIAPHCMAQFDMSSLTLTKASPVMAMLRSDVRKELKLTKEQDKAISKVEKDFEGATTRHGDDMASLMAGMGIIGKANDASAQIVALLDDKQKKRLFEIRIQMMGPPGLMDPEVAKDLGLSDDQSQKVKSIESDFWDESMHLMQTARNKGTADKLKKMREEDDSKLLDVLTADQRTKFKEMQGVTFKDARPKNSFF